MLCPKYFTYQQYEGQNLHDFVTELKKEIGQNMNLTLSITL